MSFSAVANVKKLLAHKKNPDGLDCIHGLKLVSVFLIIMGHRLMFNLGAPLINTEFIEGVSFHVNNFDSIKIEIYIEIIMRYLPLLRFII
jgi:hypothetical protein